MYRKSIFSSIKRNKDSEIFTIFHSNSIANSQLFYTKSKNEIYETVDISMSYLIIRELLDKQKDLCLYEEYSENNQLSLQTTYSELSRQNRNQHSHNFYELAFIRSGTLTYKVEEEYVSFHAGDCCLFNNNVHHLECLDQDFDAIIIGLKEDFIRKIASLNTYTTHNGEAKTFPAIFDYILIQNQATPVYNSKVYCSFHCKKTEIENPANKCIQDMLKEVCLTHSGKSLIMMGLICRLLEILQNDSYYEEVIFHAKLGKEEEILQTIADAYTDKKGIFTRNEIEKITGYNGDYIERIVKKLTGKTLTNFGRDFMLDHAANLLLNSDMKISEICMELGYANRYYFNQLFVEKYGITPSGYRKREKSRKVTQDSFPK